MAKVKEVWIFGTLEQKARLQDNQPDVETVQVYYPLFVKEGGQNPGREIFTIRRENEWGSITNTYHIVTYLNQEAVLLPGGQEEDRHHVVVKLGSSHSIKKSTSMWKRIKYLLMGEPQPPKIYDENIYVNSVIREQAIRYGCSGGPTGSGYSGYSGATGRIQA